MSNNLLKNGCDNIVLFILSGVIAEPLLWKIGYGNAEILTVNYVINRVFAVFGSTVIPYAVAVKSMADRWSLTAAGTIFRLHPNSCNLGYLPHWLQV